MTSVFSWQNSVSLCSASFCTPRPNLPVTQMFLDFLLLCSTPDGEKDIFFGVSSRRSYRSSQNCSASASSFSITGRGISLDY